MLKCKSRRVDGGRLETDLYCERSCLVRPLLQKTALRGAESLKPGSHHAFGPKSRTPQLVLRRLGRDFLRAFVH
jgi:hypothetical protein